jgi:NADH-quinone oxidoreductase subunit M
VYFGPVTNPKNEKLQDLTPREILTFAPLIAAALFIGIYPKPMFQILQQPVAQLVQTVRPGEAVMATQPVAPAVPATTNSKPLPAAIAAVRPN